MRRLWVPEMPPRREALLRAPTLQFEGWFEVELRHAASGLIVWQSRFRNLITDAGLNALGGATTPAAQSNYVAVGTDGTAPAAGQVALGAEVANGRTQNTGGPADVTGFAIDNTYFYLRRERFFGVNEANGVLAEVGTFSASSAGTMFSRQQIKDSNGIATTINKTTDFELRITYELRLYRDLADQVYSTNVNGAAQNATARAALTTSTQNWALDSAIWPNTTPDCYRLASGSFGGGTIAGATSVTQAAYVNGTFYRESTASWNAAAANMALTSFIYRNSPNAGVNVSSSFAHEFSAPPTKVNTQKADLTYRITWGRYP